MEHLNYNVKDQVNFDKNKSKQKSSKQKPKAQKKAKQSDFSDIDRVREVMKKHRKQKPKRPFPTKVVAGSITFLSILAFVNFYLDDAVLFFENLNVKVSPIAKSSAQEEKTEKVEKSTKQAPVKSVQEKTSWTEEEIKIFQGLEKRKLELDKKEKSLKALEAELAKQKEGLEGKLAKLQALRDEISYALSDEVKKDKKKIDKLVDVYSNMKPKYAAKLFEEIDEKLAIQVLAKMRKDNAAKILDNVEPDKARRLSEKYAGFMKK